MSQEIHASVLLSEAVDALLTDIDGFYVDGTLGRGGHSLEVIKKLSAKGGLMAIDKDLQALAEVPEQLQGDSRFEARHGSFADMNAWLSEQGMLGKVSGVLLDLGVSSPQLDQADRGFSFMHDGPLDMRMNTSKGVTAAQWLAEAEEADIAWVFKEYGEERFAKRMARAIVHEREGQAIVTTKRLANIVAEANPAWEKGKHPATRAFQAIRIYINNELIDLEKVLEQAIEALCVGGRLVVISFHSLEDRLVKRFIRKHVQGDALPIGLPVVDHQLNRRLRSIGKAVKASSGEVNNNPRARSAVMRVAEKIA